MQTKNSFVCSIGDMIVNDFWWFQSNIYNNNKFIHKIDVFVIEKSNIKLNIIYVT